MSSKFLARELAADLHLPASVVDPIVERIFLKILKHLMQGRTIRIPRFGKFELRFRLPKKLKSPIAGEGEVKERIVPAFKFSKVALDNVKNLNIEKAERLLREKSQ